jgi:hypothetical protein
MPVHQIAAPFDPDQIPVGGRAPLPFVKAAWMAQEEARLQRADNFCRQVLDHEGHRGFRPQQWPRSLEWGFTCDCGEEELEVRVPVSDMRALDAQDLYILYNSFHHIIAQAYQREQAKRRLNPAHRRARTLLHRHLTRVQILELKHNREFTMEGADGKTYRITEGTCNNVRLIEDGRPTKSLCIVFKDHAPLPMYDLMLVQKFLLESNPQMFYEIANVTVLPREVPRPPPDVEAIAQAARPISETTQRAVMRLKELQVRRRALQARRVEQQVQGLLAL